jgi:hypothetical protein
MFGCVCARSPLQSAGNLSSQTTLVEKPAKQEEMMGRGLLLWLIGIPLPIILLIWAFGGLH